MLLLALACAGSPPPEGGDDDDDTVVPTEPTPLDTGTPPTDTETTPPSSCEVVVTDAVASQPWRENEARIDLTLSEAATAAVACTLGDDPAEVHLVEAASAATTHELQLAGLLAGADYDCVAVATCGSTAGPATSFALTTTAAPVFYPAVQIDGDTSRAGYVLANHSDDCFWQGQRLLVFDRLGRVRWYHQTPAWVGPSVEFRWHGDGRFTWGGGWEPNDLGRPRQIDLYEGEVYDSATAIPDLGSSVFHHDGKQLPDGRLLTLEEEEVDDGGWGFRGFRVRRIDPVTGTVDFEYRSQRAYDEGHLPGGWDDVWHANWVDIVDVGGDEVLYVSLCNLGQVVAIDVATGDWRWTFGEGGDWSLVDTAGAPLRGQFSQCQHGLETTGDRLLVYDNGWDRGYSRATEYSLDEATMTATLEWTWTEPDWYESTLGDADWLPTDTVLIGAGHAECFSSNPGDRTTVIELDPATGDKLWELRYDAIDAMAYRADWADGCSLFANAAHCATVRDRLDELGL